MYLTTKYNKKNDFATLILIIESYRTNYKFLKQYFTRIKKILEIHLILKIKTYIEKIMNELKSNDTTIIKKKIVDKLELVRSIKIKRKINIKKKFKIFVKKKFTQRSKIKNKYIEIFKFKFEVVRAFFDSLFLNLVTQRKFAQISLNILFFENNLNFVRFYLNFDNSKITIDNDFSSYSKRERLVRLKFFEKDSHKRLIFDIFDEIDFQDIRSTSSILLIVRTISRTNTFFRVSIFVKNFVKNSITKIRSKISIASSIFSLTFVCIFNFNISKLLIIFFIVLSRASFTRTREISSFTKKKKKFER